MEITDPQFLYIVLILPSLFGLTLIGEGLNKILKSEFAGFISLIFGILFIGVVIFYYLFISGKWTL
jgi:hypothetical protein